jgi:putative FmdB family regulatory protein
MPTYEYRCTQCGEKLEVFHKITDEPRKTCPKCGADTLQRGPGGGIGLSFTGTGWYKTDYPSSDYNAPVPETPQPKSDCCPCGKNKSCSTD